MSDSDSSSTHQSAGLVRKPTCHCSPPLKASQEIQRRTRPLPGNEPPTAGAPTTGNTTTPPQTSSATTPATATAPGNTATPNQPPPAVLPPPVRARNPATSRWGATGATGEEGRTRRGTGVSEGVTENTSLSRFTQSFLRNLLILGQWRMRLLVSWLLR